MNTELNHYSFSSLRISYIYMKFIYILLYIIHIYILLFIYIYEFHIYSYKPHSLLQFFLNPSRKPPPKLIFFPGSLSFSFLL